MFTVFPISPAKGVYVKLNGVVPVDKGETDPAPFSVRVTLVALPPKVLPLIVIGVVPHVDPFKAPSDNDGPFTHPQLTGIDAVDDMHPFEFFATIV